MTDTIDIKWCVEELDLYTDLRWHDTHSCFDFAQMLYDNLTGMGIEAHIQAPRNDTDVHHWVFVPANNKHYDAYSLHIDGDGHEDWRDLAYWHQLSMQEGYNWHEAFITPQSESIQISISEQNL